jgi:hypothetical protein
MDYSRGPECDKMPRGILSQLHRTDRRHLEGGYLVGCPNHDIIHMGMGRGA